MRNLRLKPVFRFDRDLWWVRLFRVMWEVGTVGDGNGFSNKLSLAACLCRPFGFNRDWNEWAVTVLFLRLHYKRSFGGIHV